MTDRQLSSVDKWENEGGATKPSASSPAGPPARLPRLLHRSTKAAQDTAAGCRARAAADLATAATMDTANGRQKLEHSATTWTARGDLLARLEAGRSTRASRARPEDDPARARHRAVAGALGPAL